jgi:hypothetical protein
MPTVPVARNVVDLPRPGVSARIDAPDFTGSETVGRALQGVGRELDQAAQVKDQINDEFDRAAAKEAATHQTQFYTQNAYDPQNGLYSKRGKDALDASQPFQKSLTDNLTQLRNGLKNPRQQKYFEDITTPQMNAWSMRASEFVSQEQLSYSVDQATSRAETSLDAAARVYLDDADQGEKQIGTALGEIETAGRLQGWSDDQIHLKQADASNKAFATIASQKAIDDPVGALSFVEGHKDRMDPRTVASLEETLRPRVQRQQGIALADLLSGKGVPSTDPLAPLPDGGKALDPRAFFRAFTLPHEGGYAPHDANGAPVKYGVNQSANPGVDVKNLTEAQATEIFTKKYWDKSGASRLSPAMAAVHADTYYINPAKADQILAASNGDPNRYMSLREGWMASLVAKNPAKFGKYERAWGNRNRDLRSYAGGLAKGLVGSPSVNPKLDLAGQLQELETIDAPPEVKAAARSELAQRAQVQSIIQTQEHNSWLNDFELQLHDGKAGKPEIEAARKSGRLTDYDEVSRLEGIVEARQKEGEDLTNFGQMMGDPHFTFNQYDDTQRKAVEAGVKALGGTPDAAFQVWQKTGILAKSGAVALRGSLVSTDQKSVQAAANIAGNMLHKNPNAFAGVEGQSDIEHAATAFNHYVYDLGMDPQSAAHRIAQENDPKFKEKVKYTDPQRQEAMKMLRQNGGAQAKSVFSGAAFPNPEAQEEANQTYHELITDGLGRGLDLGAAQSDAAQQLRKVYGVNRNGRIVKYAPEAIYPAIGGSHDYIYADALKTVKAETGRDPVNINLVPIPGVTDQDFRSGKPARYRLLYSFKQNGQTIVDAVPGEFAADIHEPAKALSTQRRRSFAQERRHLTDIPKVKGQADYSLPEPDVRGPTFFSPGG